MDYLIHIRKTGTAAEFATKVGVARSTFFEYMDYMRNELNIVILYDRSAKTYYYSNKGLYDSLKQWIHRLTTVHTHHRLHELTHA